jgi:hypothetical protein
MNHLKKVSFQKRLGISLIGLLGLCGGVAILNEKLHNIFPLTHDLLPDHQGTRATLIHHETLSEDEIIPMDYTPLCEDNDGINAQLDTLKDAYRDRWKHLDEAELQECLQEIVDTLAPRYLPFITHRYKNYQFAYEDNPSSASYYTVQSGDSWMSSLYYSNDTLVSTIIYPAVCNHKESLDAAITILAHEMVHQARMHPARIHIHEDLGEMQVIDIPTDDFLTSELHVTPHRYAKTCYNLSHHQESEADYCSLIALRSIDATKDFILHRLKENHGRSDSHPSSFYRVQLGIEYWIQFVMQQDGVDRATACQQVGASYRDFLKTAQLAKNIKHVASSLAPDRPA